MKSPHRLILASAGTGKTWQLTGRYLAILFEGVAPEHVLATTFTRKAAGEILDRVLRRLVEAAEGAEARAELGRQIGRTLEESEVRAKLTELARGLDRFRVRTLDAFFVQLAKLFALELGLPTDWIIVEEAADTALRREALAQTLERAERLELLEILRHLQQADASRSVETVLLRKVENGRSAFLDSQPDAWSRVVVPPGLNAEGIELLKASLEAAEVPRTKAGPPNKNWARAKHDLSNCVGSGDWKGVLKIGLVGKVLEKETHFARVAIDPDWAELLGALLLQVRHVLLGEIDRENRAARDWLERFEISYDRLKHEERSFRFEDLPKALHPREENRIVDQDLVWYRLDARIDHLLLDEFQDTSPVQWRLLGNLAGEILADGTGKRSFFCVGDVKQSIYGWREAEPRLLASMHERHPVLEPEPLNTSYRSSAVVLDTVAGVFSTIGENRAFEDRPHRQRAAREFQRDFDAPLAAKELPGATWLIEAPEASADEQTHRPALVLAAERTRAILDDAPLASVGLLLRRNILVPELIHLLRTHGLRASGEGGNPLVDSAAVLHLISLLHLADHPGDSAAAFHVTTSPLAPHVGFTTRGFRDEREKVAAMVRRRLAVEGYGRFCGSFLAIVADGYGTWDQKRFGQLVDLAYSFEERADLRADRFVDQVRATPVEDPSATQIKVMTIHASKGLEFDAVVLPELDVKIAPRKSTLLTRRSDPTGLLEAVSHSRSQEVCTLDPDGLGSLWAQQEERETREALCLLYVAMTRARHRLDLIVQHKKTPDRVYKTFAGVLLDALAPAAAPPTRAAQSVVWSHPENTEPWHPGALARLGSEAEPATPSRPEFRASAPGALIRRTPSAQEGAGHLAPHDLLRSPNSLARLHGRLIHRWLEEIEWIEDFAASDDELLALGRSITAERGVLAPALKELRALLERPRTRALLSRDAQADDGATREVWRERSFAVVLPSEPMEELVQSGRAGEDHEVLWSGTFDRVVLRRQADSLVSAEVLDFKTDRIEAVNVEERSAFYRPQLASYRRVLAHMTGLPVEAVRARILFVRLDEVREA